MENNDFEKDHCCLGLDRGGQCLPTRPLPSDLDKPNSQSSSAIADVVCRSLPLLGVRRQGDRCVGFCPAAFPCGFRLQHQPDDGCWAIAPGMGIDNPSARPPATPCRPSDDPRSPQAGRFDRHPSRVAINDQHHPATQPTQHRANHFEIATCSRK